MRATIRVLACLVVFVLAETTAWTQGFQGGIRGAIRDPGGVIPGVEVTLTNENTSVSRGTTTNDRGEYNFPNLADALVSDFDRTTFEFPVVVFVLVEGNSFGLVKREVGTD